MAANSLVLPFLALGLVALLVVQPREGAAAEIIVQQPAETCQALESLGSCSANTACTEADCSFSVPGLGFTFTAELTLLPCNEPPAVRVILSGSSVLLNTVLERSQTFSLSISGIDVDIVATFQQTARGVGIRIQAQTLSFFTITIPVISYTEIPLETAGCTATVAASTCEVLRELAADPGSDDFECSTNEACNGVNCAADLLGNGDYRASAVILSCSDPPAVRLTIVSPSITVLLNDTFDHSRNVTISQLLGLQVTVMVEQLTNAIAIQIDAIPPPQLAQGTIAIIGYTVIPIDSSQCGSTSPAPIQTSSTTAASTTPSTAASTTPSTEASTTPRTAASTTPSTAAPTTPSTAAPTTPSTAASTTPSTAASTTPSTAASTTPSTEAQTTPSTAAPTTPSTAALTTPSTEAPTTPSTEAPTTPSTEAPTTPRTVAPTTPSRAAPTTPSTAAPTTQSTAAPTTPSTAAPTTPSTASPTSTIITTSISPAVPSASTCEVLEDLAANPGSDEIECSIVGTAACNGVECTVNLPNFGEYRASAVIVSCSDPPAVRLTIADPRSTVLLNDTFDHSRTVTISQLFGLQVAVTVDQNPKAIGIQIDAIPPQLISPDPITVVKYTIIPIDTSQCPSPTETPTSTGIESTVLSGQEVSGADKPSEIMTAFSMATALFTLFLTCYI